MYLIIAVKLGGEREMREENAQSSMFYTSFGVRQQFLRKRSYTQDNDIACFVRLLASSHSHLIAQCLDQLRAIRRCSCATSMSYVFSCESLVAQDQIACSHSLTSFRLDFATRARSTFLTKINNEVSISTQTEHRSHEILFSLQIILGIS